MGKECKLADRPQKTFVRTKKKFLQKKSERWQNKSGMVESQDDHEGCLPKKVNAKISFINESERPSKEGVFSVVRVADTVNRQLCSGTLS